MPREMLSGPDLGAGFLFQLSLDREGGRVAFTFHAQVGGPDAAGPPKGTPEPLGWTRAGEMCMFGGRGCWHRSFELPEASLSKVRASYNRCRFVMATRIDQAFEGAAVPLVGGLSEWIDRASPPLTAAGAPWCLGGTAALRVQGVNVPVREVVVHTVREGVAPIAAALRDYLIEPEAPTAWGTRTVVGARAFVGTPASGLCVGWEAPSGGPSEEAGLSEWTMISDGVRPRAIQWEGRQVFVVPIELGLREAAEEGGVESCREVVRAIDPKQVDRALLRRLLRSTGWPVGTREAVEVALKERDPSLLQA